MRKYLGFVAVSVFLFSCTNTERDNPYDELAVNYIGKSSAEGSSSSVAPSSSSVARPCTPNNNTDTHYCSEGTMKEYGFLTDSRDDKVYKTVVIGTQTWMAENLNYNASGSKCFSNKSTNCDIYGRLYDWSTALYDWSMDRVTCPDGWHLPNDEEWTILTDYVGGSSTAGAKLKATSGWDFNGNGTNYYGFSALPGGYCLSSGTFTNDGIGGFWWSATESNTSDAYLWRMYSNYSNVYRDNYSKSYLHSVRCLKD
jgi:uncharacterized protein (TIGR02145 family)